MFNATLPYRKMNGLGNDFAVLDARVSRVSLTVDAARRLADRRSGVGCDQIIILEPSPRADVFMRILNADGSEVNACGNATRCVAGLLAEELGGSRVVIETGAGLLRAEVAANGRVSVDMGLPRFGWEEIPLSRPFADTNAIDFTPACGGGALSRPSVVNVGNPHCIFWVPDLDAFDLAAIGPSIEHDPLFPERVNVSLAQVVSRDRIILRVWERGSGITRACGTAACATGVAAARRGLTGREVAVELPGGVLDIAWRESDGHFLMAGPWSLDHEGVFELGAPAPAQ